MTERGEKSPERKLVESIFGEALNQPEIIEEEVSEVEFRHELTDLVIKYSQEMVIAQNQIQKLVLLERDYLHDKAHNQRMKYFRKYAVRRDENGEEIERIPAGILFKSRPKDSSGDVFRKTDGKKNKIE